ncbi:putative glycosylphosphatidylinositol-alpha 1,2 mannosyltransferase [Sporobolomyces koalae]|uniref:putative glycosylphosphatidylinositol-alpha 1,2 mannosyltransferase n=1 Tax=Sporobolomyces koalae TaxID=500713 RepID=UPI0031745BB1
MRALVSTPLLLALAFRCVNAVVSRAFFQPDEYWQSLEVAHRLVFGYGWSTWEWQPSPGLPAGGKSSAAAWWSTLRDGGRGGIRSPLSVLPTVAIYWVLRVAGLDGADEWLVLAPRLVQGCIAASSDMAIRTLAEMMLGPEFATATMVASLTSFFNFWTATRTFSNSTETALTVWALRWWPWELYRLAGTAANPSESSMRSVKKRLSTGSLQTALILAALATLIRPSNAIIWLILGSRLFLQSSTRRRRSILLTASLVSVFAVSFSLVLDTTFYDTPTFTPLRFLSTNVFHSISLFYGQNPWHFYIFQGLPILLLTQLLFLVDGIALFWRSKPPSVRNPSALTELGCTALGTIVSYSLLSHKEWRFLHPILPILQLFVAISLVTAYQRYTTTANPKRSNAPGLYPLQRLALKCRIKLSHILVLGVALVPAFYLTAYHTKGQTDVMLWLRDEMRLGRSGLRFGNDKIESVGFAMPCHSTPWQSHLHSEELEGPVSERSKLWFIGCEPPISEQSVELYQDQSDHFYAAPSTYFLNRFPPTVDPSFPPCGPNCTPHPDPYTLSPSSPVVLQARQALESQGFDRGWRHTWPSHLVVFKNLLKVSCRPNEDCSTVGSLLLDKMGYRVEKEFWNGIAGWHEDDRRKGGVVVLRWQGN